MQEQSGKYLKHGAFNNLGLSNSVFVKGIRNIENGEVRDILQILLIH